MFFVSFDESRSVWNLRCKAGRIDLDFDSAVVVPKNGKFEGSGEVKIAAIHGLVVTSEDEEVINANEWRKLGVGAPMGKLRGPTWQLNQDGTYEVYRV